MNGLYKWIILLLQNISEFIVLSTIIAKLFLKIFKFLKYFFHIFYSIVSLIIQYELLLNWLLQISCD